MFFNLIFAFTYWVKCERVFFEFWLCELDATTAPTQIHATVACMWLLLLHYRTQVKKKVLQCHCSCVAPAVAVSGQSSNIFFGLPPPRFDSAASKLKEVLMLSPDIVKVTGGRFASCDYSNCIIRGLLRTSRKCVIIYEIKKKRWFTFIINLNIFMHFLINTISPLWVFE